MPSGLPSKAYLPLMVFGVIGMTVQALSNRAANKTDNRRRDMKQFCRGLRITPVNLRQRLL
jgi:hypothetical protein